MRIELDEACDCTKPLPGYVKLGHRLCIGCNLYIISRTRKRRLHRVQVLTFEKESAGRGIQTKTKRTGIPTSPRSQT